MPWFLQMAGCAVSILLIAFALWIGFWVFMAFMAISILVVSWRHIRNYLVDKGILNPTPGVPSGGLMIEEESTTTIIEGDFERVDEEKQD